MIKQLIRLLVPVLLLTLMTILGLAQVHTNPPGTLLKINNTQKNEAATLFLSFQVVNNQIKINADLGSQHKAYLLSHNADELTKRFNRIYAQIEEQTFSKKQLLLELNLLGKLLFEPISPFIESSSQIEFIIPKELIKFPLDLLIFKEQFLFLYRPVSYSFSKQMPENFSFTSDWKAIIVSDPTADPENGCYLLKKMLPSSTYYKINQINIQKFKTLNRPDLLLISAHGDISFSENDCISIKDDELYPQHLSQLRPKLAYLDSCQLGASYQFIQSFQKSGTQYYVAPLISNEAGDSSTKTISYFFDSLKNSQLPAFALFSTRKRLYSYFKEKEDLPNLLWKAFPFRVYRLN